MPRPVTPTPTATAKPSITATATRTATLTATGTPTPTPSVTAVVFQQGNSPAPSYNGALDTYLDSWNPASNFSTASGLYVRANDYQAMLFSYDLSSIPPDAEIEQATLSLYAYASSNQNLMVADIFGVARPWLITETTWLSATARLPWSVPGCNDPGVDRYSAPADLAQGFDSVSRWYTFTVTSLVEQWMANPATNFGMIVKGRDGGSAQVLYSFSSAEAINPALRPFLTVIYRLPGASAPP